MQQLHFSSMCLVHVICQWTCVELKVLGHQVFLCFHRKSQRGVHHPEHHQSSTLLRSVAASRLCHACKRRGHGQGQEPTGTGSRMKDSFFGVGVEEMQTASFPVKKLKGKMSFPIVSAHRISSPHGRTLMRSSTSSMSCTGFCSGQSQAMLDCGKSRWATQHEGANRQLATVKRGKPLLLSSHPQLQNCLPPSVPALEPAGSPPWADSTC